MMALRSGERLKKLRHDDLWGDGKAAFCKALVFGGVAQAGPIGLWHFVEVEN